MDKPALRAEIRARIKAIDEGEKARRSTEIFTRIDALDAIRSARCVATYMPLADEVDSRRFADRLAEHCRVVIPRVEGDGMDFYDYVPERLSSGAFGIDEPAGEKAARVEDIDVMIVPARAFTPEGDRLGRGKGYYDRYLSRKGFRAVCIGVCFAEQMVKNIPCDAHDRRVDMVIYG